MKGGEVGAAACRQCWGACGDPLGCATCFPSAADGQGWDLLCSLVHYNPQARWALLAVGRYHDLVQAEGAGRDSIRARYWRWAMALFFGGRAGRQAGASALVLGTAEGLGAAAHMSARILPGRPNHAATLTAAVLRRLSARAALAHPWFGDTLQSQLSSTVQVGPLCLIPCALTPCVFQPPAFNCLCFNQGKRGGGSRYPGPADPLPTAALLLQSLGRAASLGTLSVDDDWLISGLARNGTEEAGGFTEAWLK